MCTATPHVKVLLDLGIKADIDLEVERQEQTLETVFQHLTTEKTITTIFIDGEKPKWYEHKLQKVLRDKDIALKKLKTVRSKSEVGIQLADCLASLIRYYHDNPEEKDAKKWFNKLKREKKLLFELLVNKA